MKKTLLTAFAVLIGIALNAQISVWDGTAEEWTHGSGTPEDPYLIESAQNMAYLSEQVNALNTYGVEDVFVDTFFKLTTDLDLGGADGLLWTPIGKSDLDHGRTTWFCGHFDGDSHIVHNMRVEFPDDFRNYSFGLFGNARYGSIKNITLDSDCSVDIKSGIIYGDIGIYVGGLLGLGDKINLENCENRAYIRADCDATYFGSACGGLVGLARSGAVITNCHNKGDVYSRDYNDFGSHAPAGIVSQASDCTVFGCTNSGNITCVKFDYGIHDKGVASGGIVGNAERDCIVEQCCNTGTLLTDEVDATEVSICSGGIVGSSFTGATIHTLNLLIKNCYSVSDINAISAMTEQKGNFAGGIFGGTYTSYNWELDNYVTNITIENCYVAGTIYADTIGGILAKYGLMPEHYTFPEKETMVSNSYYINTIESCNEYGTAVSEDYMKSVDFVNTLNANGVVFKMDEDNTNNGYPVFVNNGTHYSVNENTVHNVISVYPNPASDIINIRCAGSERYNSVEILSLDGRNVMSSANDLESIDISCLSPGMYIMKVRMDDGTVVSSQFVKQ